MRNKVNEDDQVGSASDSAREEARGILTILQSAVLLSQPSIFGLGYGDEPLCIIDFALQLYPGWWDSTAWSSREYICTTN